MKQNELVRTLSKRELIGLDVDVASEGNSPYGVIAGKVVDETRNTFVVETARGERVVPKMGQRFTFTLPNGDIVPLDGASIQYNPVDRTKKSR